MKRMRQATKLERIQTIFRCEVVVVVWIKEAIQKSVNNAIALGRPEILPKKLRRSNVPP